MLCMKIKTHGIARDTGRIYEGRGVKYATTAMESLS